MVHKKVVVYLTDTVVNLSRFLYVFVSFTREWMFRALITNFFHRFKFVCMLAGKMKNNTLTVRKSRHGQTITLLWRY